jgi:hypothetical protein
MQPTRSKPWLPYVAPMGIYMAFLLAQSNANLVWVYPAKIVAVAAALIYFRKQYEELRSPMWCSGAPKAFGAPSFDVNATTCAPNSESGRSYNGAVATWLLAILVGLAAIAVWIGIDPFYHHLGNAMPFDPTAIG